MEVGIIDGDTHTHTLPPPFPSSAVELAYCNSKSITYGGRINACKELLINAR